MMVIRFEPAVSKPVTCKLHGWKAAGPNHQRCYKCGAVKARQ